MFLNLPVVLYHLLTNLVILNSILPSLLRIAYILISLSKTVELGNGERDEKLSIVYDLNIWVLSCYLVLLL